jgi:hypothetical protein
LSEGHEVGSKKCKFSFNLVSPSLNLGITDDGDADGPLGSSMMGTPMVLLRVLTKIITKRCKIVHMAGKI